MPAINAVPRMVLPENSVGHALIATANSARDGTGTIGTVYTAGTKGSLIELVKVKATGITTAGMVRLFLHDGTNYRLYEELAVTAVAAPGATTKTFEIEYVPSKPLVLPTGWSLRASTHNAEEFVVRATGGDY